MQPEFITYRVVMSEHRERIARAEQRARIVSLRGQRRRRRWSPFGFLRHRALAREVAASIGSAGASPAPVPRTAAPTTARVRPVT